MSHSKLFSISFSMSKNTTGPIEVEIANATQEIPSPQNSALESDQSALYAAQTKWETCVVDAKELTKEIATLVVLFNFLTIGPSARS